MTSIGTPQQAYVAKEISDNKFSIGGAPNTKVSWAVHAERNDPTLQYFNRQSAYEAVRETKSQVRKVNILFRKLSIRMSQCA